MSPEDYKYVLPEGYEFKPEHRAKIDDLMEKLGADNDSAQELINIHVEIIEDYVNELNKAVIASAVAQGNLDSNYQPPQTQGD